jgi:hypothetical protein
VAVLDLLIEAAEVEEVATPAALLVLLVVMVVLESCLSLTLQAL